MPSILGWELPELSTAQETSGFYEQENLKMVFKLSASLLY